MKRKNEIQEGVDKERKREHPHLVSASRKGYSKFPKDIRERELWVRSCSCATCRRRTTSREDAGMVRQTCGHPIGTASSPSSSSQDEQSLRQIFTRGCIFKCGCLLRSIWATTTRDVWSIGASNWNATTITYPRSIRAISLRVANGKRNLLTKNSENIHIV